MSKDINRRKALAALLESDTLTEAAEKAGISRKTLYTYLTTDREFNAAFLDAKAALEIAQIESIIADQERARAIVREIMEDENNSPAIRLQAARTMLGGLKRADRLETSANVSMTNAYFALKPKNNPFASLYD